MSEKFQLENALSELEGIVRKLESKDVTLDDSMELFQKGIELSRKCAEKLTVINGRVEKLKVDIDSLTVEKFYPDDQ